MKMLKRMLSGSGLMLLATILGVATAGGALATMNHFRDQARVEAGALQDKAALRAVVVTRQPISAGTKLTTAMVETREVPAPLVLSGGFSDVKEAAGRVTRFPLVAGEQVLAARMVSGDVKTGSGLAFAVPENMRAISVPVSEISGAGGLIVPGDRVDILVATDYQSLFAPYEFLARQVAGNAAADESRRPTVFTVLQDVLVLAVGQAITDTVDGQRDPATLRAEDAKAQPKAASVTLAVTLDQAQMLFMSSKNGTIGLALRPYGDSSRNSIAPLLKLQPQAVTPASVQP